MWVLIPGLYYEHPAKAEATYRGSFVYSYLSTTPHSAWKAEGLTQGSQALIDSVALPPGYPANLCELPSPA